MRLIQLSGPHLVVTEFSDMGVRATEVANPWEIDGIASLIAAMTGASSSPVIVAPPSLSPPTPFVGDPVSVFPGIFNGATPSVTLRLNGNNVTSQIINGQFTPLTPGSLVLTVNAAPLPPISVSATISPLPVQPAAPAKMDADEWGVTTGSGPGEILLEIAELPVDGGSPINSFLYTVNNGTPQTLPGGTGAGTRVIMAQAGAEVSVSVWAVNGIGPAEASEPKLVIAGAGAVVTPAIITRSGDLISVENPGTFPDHTFIRTGSTVSVSQGV